MWRSHKEELLDHPLLTTDEIKSLLTDLERIGWNRILGSR